MAAGKILERRNKFRFDINLTSASTQVPIWVCDIIRRIRESFCGILSLSKEERRRESNVARHPGTPKSVSPSNPHAEKRCRPCPRAKTLDRFLCCQRRKTNSRSLRISFCTKARVSSLALIAPRVPGPQTPLRGVARHAASGFSPCRAWAA